jgi:hypothetical protein
MMKKTVITLVSILWAVSSSAQFDAIDPAYEYIPHASITVGVLQGGGSLVGFDLETLLGRNVGIQVGAGIVGFGGGLNFHFRPEIRSSFISFQYWNQGFGESHTQSLMSANYVYRARKIFTFQIGLGLPLDKGPGWPESMEQPPAMLTYAVGLYFPL